jgi:hypothetical protein
MLRTQVPALTVTPQVQPCASIACVSLHNEAPKMLQLKVGQLNEI